MNEKRRVNLIDFLKLFHYSNINISMISLKENGFSCDVLYAPTDAHFGLVGRHQCSLAVKDIEKIDNKNRS